MSNTSLVVSKSDKTPLRRISTFLVKSPSSYPTYTSSVLISSAVPIPTVTPSHPKNWLTVLSVYVITLEPDIKVPVAPNPMVESTVIIESLIAVGLITLVFGVTVNVPSIRALSL